MPTEFNPYYREIIDAIERATKRVPSQPDTEGKIVRGAHSLPNIYLPTGIASRYYTILCMESPHALVEGLYGDDDFTDYLDRAGMHLVTTISSARQRTFNLPTDISFDLHQMAVQIGPHTFLIQWKEDSKQY